MANLCACDSCPSGVAPKYLIKFSGFANASPPVCTKCASFNNDYTTDEGVCLYGANLVPSICGEDTIRLEFGPDGVTVALDIIGVEWTTSDFSSCIQDEPIVLSLMADPPGDCDWPSTVTIEPVDPADLSDLNGATCVPAGQSSAPQGLLVTTVNLLLDVATAIAGVTADTVMESLQPPAAVEFEEFVEPPTVDCDPAVSNIRPYISTGPNSHILINV